jgi:cytoskeletal protein CcmA (bactofilin family)
MSNLNVLASLTINGGTYDHVRVMGTLKVTDHLIAEKLSVYGSLKATGKCDIKNMTVNGAAKFESEVEADDLTVNGSCSFQESVKVRELKVRGAVKFLKKVHRASLIEILGAITTDTLEADTVIIKGALKCQEQLNADHIELSAQSHSTIKEMVGSKIHVKSEKKLFSRNKPGDIQVEFIEGDEVILENVTAKLVRGNKVIIGPNCKIEKVEYHESYEAVKNTQVGESVKS